MTATTTPSLFQPTIQKTDEWLDGVMDTLRLTDKAHAYSALRATLHALRDRLTIDEVAQLGAQLPMLVRGFYYEGWDPTINPSKERHKEQFLARIAESLRGVDAVAAERIARAVFTVMARRVSAGEIEDVKHVLPGDVRELWP
jgi:uncharacterized protein (DUF2267 family)